MLASGCVVKKHDGSVESAQILVLDLVGNSPVVLKLQQEIADGKTLIDIEAGVSLNEKNNQTFKRNTKNNSRM
jgi:hypothetical protein